MPFCDHCYQIFTTLSTHCADLEILQMRVRHFLSELNKLIVKDTRHNDRTINNIRKQLKTKLVEKCNLVISKIHLSNKQLPINYMTY